MSRINFHGSKDVRVIEIPHYLSITCCENAIQRLSQLARLRKCILTEVFALNHFGHVYLIFYYFFYRNSYVYVDPDQML